MDTYTVKKVVKETPDVTTVHFVDKSDSHPLFESGQYVTVNFADLGVPEGKAYSLSSIPDDPTMTITVKAIGPYSNRICSLRPGDEFQVSQPYGFLYSEENSPLVCIAGGVGIGPLWSIIRNSLRKNPERKIRLLYSNKTKQDIAFHDAIAELAARHSNFTVEHYITRQGVRSDKIYKSGRIDISSAVQNDIAPDSFFILCGRVSFVTDIYQSLRSNEVQDDFISTETFF